MRIALRDGVIHAFCREHDISRDELARRMGVATTTAYRVEKGAVEPSPRFIAALMLTTGLAFESLFAVITDAQGVPA